MKNIVKIIIVVCLVLLNASCSLDENVYTQADESYIVDAEMAESVLLGVYRKLTMDDGVYRLNLSMLFAMPTDEAKVEGSSLTAQRTEGSNAYTASSTYVQQSWQALYSAVYNANYFLEMIERKAGTFPEEDREVCNIYVAEARALRGLIYFELVRWFGNVPLIKSTKDSYLPAEEFVQADPKDVYEFIEEDLKYAVENLPYAMADEVRDSNSFRFSKGAALGLLSKVYATWAGYPIRDTSKWELAAETAETLVKSGEHSLLSDFEQLWYNAGNNIWDPAESLIEMSYYSPMATNESSGRVGNFNGVRAQSGGLAGGNHSHSAFFRVNCTFLTGWKDWENDKRWELSFADYQYASTGKQNMVQKRIDGVLTDITFKMAWDEATPSWDESWRSLYALHLFARKWDTEVYVDESNRLVDNNYTNINWYVLRYADVLLLYAEALNEVNQGPTAEAYEAVNMIRRRGFGLAYAAPDEMADLASGLSYEDFQQAVRDERSYELAFEGNRRQDLIRWGIYYETVANTYRNLTSWSNTAPDYYLAGIYTKKNKHELLPIPQREMDLCPQFKQNPGW